ncbi:MAG: hypothetical protein NC822_07560, partial [Candidatus Omnitrophica bacterium]|nr:hypothetical protein [Candidatus Omnitrophota bacterium]
MPKFKITRLFFYRGVLFKFKEGRFKKEEVKMSRKSLLVGVIFYSLCLLLCIGANASTVISTPNYDFGNFNQMTTATSYIGGFIRSRWNFQHHTMEIYNGGYVSITVFVVPDAQNLYNSLGDKRAYINWLNAKLSSTDPADDELKKQIKILDRNE